MWLLCLIMYFAPTVLAAMVGSKKTSAIFFLNLFTGWTLVGWVGAGVWALASERQS